MRAKCDGPRPRSGFALSCARPWSLVVQAAWTLGRRRPGEAEHARPIGAILAIVDLGEACEGLVAAAYDAGGTGNITALVVRVGAAR